MRPLAIESLSVRQFRNLESVDVEFGPGFNVVAGDNAQGKTNLLEALYVLATSRSFRTPKLGDLVRTATDVASVRGCVRELEERREQCVGLRSRGGPVRVVSIDGKRPSTLASYAVRTPVVAFHPGVIALSVGGGVERRRLLDRLALYLWPASTTDVMAYTRAARARQLALETRGERSSDLDGWEELMVRHGGAWSSARRDATERLALAAEEAFARIGPPGVCLTMRYDRRSPPDAELFRAELARSRARDRARGSASVGPHRDDLVLELAGRSVREFASQGQHRAVVLALELGEMGVVADARGALPVWLLDDVSSELDASRMRSLLREIGDRDRGGGQVILTTTRPELLASGAELRMGERRDFRVVGGRIERV